MHGIRDFNRDCILALNFLQHDQQGCGHGVRSHRESVPTTQMDEGLPLREWESFWFDPYPPIRVCSIFTWAEQPRQRLGPPCGQALLGGKVSASLLQRLQRPFIELRVLRIDVLQGMQHDGTGDQPCHPLVVRRHDVPRSPLGAGVAQHR